MKRCLPVVAAAAVLALTATAACKKESSEKEGASKAKPGQLAKPFFYAAKKGGHTAYLFGTIHIGVEPDKIPDWVLAKLDGAKTFAMETDIADPSMIQAIMRTDGSTLDQEIGPEYWKKFEDAVGADMALNFKNMKTSAAATVVDIAGLPTTQPIDLALLMRAKKGKKEIVYLEPAKKQLDLLDKWLDVRALKAMLDDLGEQKKKNKELIDAYLAGDEAKAVAMSKDDSDFVKQGRTHEEFAQMMKELLLDRNVSWIGEIDEMTAKGDAFIAVGAMHLAGPGSVPELLKEKGFAVERLAPP